ncbi:MAG: hypothetical protein AAF799_47515 [Myxococcota bacterium]
MKISKILMIGLGLSLAGCPSDDTGDTTGAGSDSTAGATGATGAEETGATDAATDDGDTTAGEETAADETEEPPPEVCNGTSEEGAAVGDSCTAHSDCMSGVCTLYTDVPVNKDAVCAETPANCGTRVTGTIFDFVTGEPVSGADLVVAAALQAATNPTGAMALVEATSDGDGRVDGTSDSAISAPLGIVGLASAGGYFLTATGVSAPLEDGSSYDVGAGAHDLWIAPTDALDAWSTALGEAGVAKEDLPLGENGGAIGMVRGADGVPIAGAVVESTGDSSEAVIRYLNDDGSFGEDSTSDLGIFVITNPAVPESFQAVLNDNVLGGGTGGSANGAVFTLVITASE